MSVPPKLTYRFNAIPIKIPASYFMDINNLILKFIWRGKNPVIAKPVLKVKNKSEGLMLPDFKTYYKAIVIKIMQYG